MSAPSHSKLETFSTISRHKIKTELFKQNITKINKTAKSRMYVNRMKVTVFAVSAKPTACDDKSFVPLSSGTVPFSIQMILFICDRLNSCSDLMTFMSLRFDDVVDCVSFIAFHRRRKIQIKFTLLQNTPIDILVAHDASTLIYRFDKLYQ